MKINQLKLLSIAICCLLSILWSDALCMEGREEYTIPNKIILDGRPWVSDVCDQGQKSTCSSHAVCDLLKYCYGKIDITPLDLHRDAHKHFGITTDVDSTGHHIPQLMEFVRDSKCLFQNIIDISKSDLLGDTEVKRIKSVLLNYRLPVVVEVVSKEGDKELFNEGENIRKLPDRLLPQIRPGESNKIRLGHAVIVYGYSDKEHGFLIKNSWGTNFLSRGLAILSYNYLTQYSLNTSYTGWMDPQPNLLEKQKFAIREPIDGDENIILLEHVRKLQNYNMNYVGLLNVLDAVSFYYSASLTECQHESNPVLRGVKSFTQKIHTQYDYEVNHVDERTPNCGVKFSGHMESMVDLIKKDLEG